MVSSGQAPFKASQRMRIEGFGQWTVIPFDRLGLLRVHLVAPNALKLALW
jgi:hypothetical protein